MKKIIILTLLVVAGCFAIPNHCLAEPAVSAAQVKYEYAIVKWDGPDRLLKNLPSGFEVVHLSKIGVTIPRDAQNEEFCLSLAANLMAKDGWEPINLNSRRILFRRPVVAVR